MSQANLGSPSQRSATSSPTQQKAANRQSLPPQRVSAASPPASSPTQATGRASTQKIPEEHEPAEEVEGEEDDDRPGRVRKGTMSKNFRFPSPNPAQAPPPVPPVPPAISVTSADEHEQAPEAGTEGPQTPPKADGPASTKDEEAELTTVSVIAPSTVEVPPPPPVDKERPLGSANDLDDDVGETEEISLN